jgi:serine/threonine protein kinase
MSDLITHIPPKNVVKFLSSGASGSVYLAERVDTREQVAIKQIDVSHASSLKAALVTLNLSLGVYYSKTHRTKARD